MTVLTRFAPSPTGTLHIGGARTALFNWLYARRHGGRFLLRIEDTDRARSTKDAIDAIIDGLKWLGLEWDSAVVFQSAHADAHAGVARRLLDDDMAYLCFATIEELETMRAEARAEGRPVGYDGRWRDRDSAEAPRGVPPVIRFKAPRDGETVVRDAVQGDVRIANDQLDDMVLLRADGTPTYMLSVVVDDHRMGITHVIRGDDHLNNAARQQNLFSALGWTVPAFAHVPLIHGSDGKRLSKRHGALGIEAYRERGYLAAALRNYLVKLGWSHGDDEIISTEQAIAWFDLDAVGRSPARFDVVKLDNLNGHYMRQANDRDLLDMIAPKLTETLAGALDADDRERLLRAMPNLKERAKSLVELSENALFYVIKGIPPLDAHAAKLLDGAARAMIARLKEHLDGIEVWEAEPLEMAVREFAEHEGVALRLVAQPLRAALTGRAASPPIFDVLAILGRTTSMERLASVTSN